jgi:DNA-binding NtrC family response regulator
MARSIRSRASSSSLRAEVAAGRFRADLYYRLSVLTLPVPPLRERREDIPLLVRHFLALAPGRTEEIELSAMQALLAYDWPGNVRELRNALLHAQLLAEGPAIRSDDLPESVRLGPASCSATEEAPAANCQTNLDDVIRTLIRETLASHGGNKSQAARSLGISRQRLYRLQGKHRRG